MGLSRGGAEAHAGCGDECGLGREGQKQSRACGNPGKTGDGLHQDGLVEMRRSRLI